MQTPRPQEHYQPPAAPRPEVTTVTPPAPIHPNTETVHNLAPPDAIRDLPPRRDTARPFLAVLSGQRRMPTLPREQPKMPDDFEVTTENAGSTSPEVVTDATPPAPRLTPDEIMSYAARLPAGSLKLRTEAEQAQQLRAEGTAATEVFLDTMRICDREVGIAVDGLARSATGEDLPLITEYIEEVGATRAINPRLLFRVVGRIADGDVLSSLVRYVDSVDYYQLDESPCDRARQVLPIAIAALQRANTEAEADGWNDVIDQWQAMMPGDYVPETPLHPEEEALRHAESFFYDHREREASPALPNKFLDPEERVAQVKDVYSVLAKRHPELPAVKNLQALEARLRTREAHAPAHTITIGAEVEIERILAQDRTRQETPDERASRFFTLLGDFRATEDAGLPAGKDELWEFAHNPVRHHETLTRELQALVAASTINTKETEHPMHLTLGGISLKGAAGCDAFILARALEATGWSTSAARLMRPLGNYEPHWASDNRRGGIKERQSDEIVGTTPCAIELSPFIFKSINGAARTFNSAQALGSALAAHQYIAQKGQPTETQQQLAAIWQSFATEITPLFVAQGMDHPADEPWTTRYDVKELRTYIDANFVKLAGILAEAQRTPTSASAAFQNDIQRSIIKHRAAAWRTLYR